MNLRELALSEARNVVGPNEALPIFLKNECLSPAEYAAIAANPTYQRYLKDFTAELRESGFSFAAKSRVLAEDLLADIYRMAKSIETPAAMRVKTLENLVEWGKLAPKKDPSEVAGAGFSVTINLGNTPTATVNVAKTTAPAPKKAFYDSENAPQDVTDITPKTPESALEDPVARLSDLSRPLSEEELAYYAAEASHVPTPVQAEMFPETLP